MCRSRVLAALVIIGLAHADDTERADSKSMPIVPLTVPELRIEEGKMWIGQRQFGRAIDALEEAISLDPETADAHFQLGVAYSAAEGHAFHHKRTYARSSEALHSWQTAVKLNPQHTTALVQLATTLGRRGQDDANVEQAIVWLEKLIRIKPDYWKGYVELGKMLERLQRLDEAKNYYQQVIDEQPKEALALHTHGHLSRVLAHTHEYSEAEHTHLHAMRIDPSHYTSATKRFGLIQQQYTEKVEEQSGGSFEFELDWATRLRPCGFSIAKRARAAGAAPTFSVAGAHETIPLQEGDEILSVANVDGEKAELLQSHLSASEAMGIFYKKGGKQSKVRVRFRRNAKKDEL